MPDFCDVVKVGLTTFSGDLGSFLIWFSSGGSVGFWLVVSVGLWMFMVGMVGSGGSVCCLAVAVGL